MIAPLFENSEASFRRVYTGVYSKRLRPHFYRCRPKNYEFCKIYTGGLTMRINNPELRENDRGTLTHFDGRRIVFTAKSTDYWGNPVLKVFDVWGNYSYIKGTDAYRYSHCYDLYISGMGNLYAFKSKRKIRRKET